MLAGAAEIAACSKTSQPRSGRKGRPGFLPREMAVAPPLLPRQKRPSAPPPHVRDCPRRFATLVPGWSARFVGLRLLALALSFLLLILLLLVLLLDACPSAHAHDHTHTHTTT